jgi:GPI mannosyltransferase 2
VENLQLQMTNRNGSGARTLFQVFTGLCKVIIGKCYASRRDCRRSDFPFRNVGFLRYWTISNVPLFVLAFPVLTIMIVSSLWTIRIGASSKNVAGSTKPTTGPQQSLEQRLLRSLAAPQLLLAILALTSYHVQIITRISSGYCIWYFWLAHAIILSAEKSPMLKGDKFNRWKLGGSTEIVMYIVIYAAVQGGLFSSFLPPA